MTLTKSPKTRQDSNGFQMVQANITDKTSIQDFDSLEE